MKNAIFISALGFAGCYLAYSEVPAINQWFEQQSPQRQLNEALASLGQGMDDKIDGIKEQLLARQQDEVKKLQTQIAALQREVQQLKHHNASTPPAAVVSSPVANRPEVVASTAHPLLANNLSTAGQDEAQPVATSRRQSLRELVQKMNLTAAQATVE